MTRVVETQEKSGLDSSIRELKEIMAVTKRRYTKEEFARRGDALVESKVRPNLATADEDKFVAIDIESGEYELDKNELRAADRLRKRVLDAQIWLVHVTLGYLHRLSWNRPREEQSDETNLQLTTARVSGGVHGSR